MKNAIEPQRHWAFIFTLATIAVVVNAQQAIQYAKAHSIVRPDAVVSAPPTTMQPTPTVETVPSPTVQAAPVIVEAAPAPNVEPDPIIETPAPAVVVVGQRHEERQPKPMEVKMPKPQQQPVQASAPPKPTETAKVVPQQHPAIRPTQEARIQNQIETAAVPKPQENATVAPTPTPQRQAHGGPNQHPAVTPSVPPPANNADGDHPKHQPKKKQ